MHFGRKLCNIIQKIVWVLIFSSCVPICTFAGFKRVFVNKEENCLFEISSCTQYTSHLPLSIPRLIQATGPATDHLSADISAGASSFHHPLTPWPPC